MIKNLSLPQPDIKPPRNHKWGDFNPCGYPKFGDNYFIDGAWQVWKNNNEARMGSCVPTLSPIRTYHASGVPCNLPDFLKDSVDVGEYQYFEDIACGERDYYYLPCNKSWFLQPKPSDVRYNHVMKCMSPKEEPDEYLKFEVLDRTHMILEHFTTALEGHPGLYNTQLMKKYKAAEVAVVALYVEAVKSSLK